MVRGGAVEGGVLSPRQQGARGHAARGDQSARRQHTEAMKDPPPSQNNYRDASLYNQSEQSKYFVPSLEAV